VSEQTFSIDQLVDLHPRLFHMAAGGSWDRIEKHGLLPTAHLVESSELPAADQAALLRQHRAVSTVINHPVYGTVTIRDQKPLRLQFLQPVLSDVTVEQWLAILNDRVFFWLHPTRLAGLLRARAYKNHPQDVLTLDTNSLVRAHENNVRLSPINSGSALYPNAVERGSLTFSSIKDYPYAQRRKDRSVPDALVELAVVGGVPDVSRHVLGVARYIGPDFQYSIAGNSRPV
jgi:hypothetical protein